MQHKRPGFRAACLFLPTLAFTDLDLVSWPFKQLHAAISSTNDVIRAIETEGVQVGAEGAEAQMVLAAAYFCKAMRLINPTYPERFPATANSYPQATSADKRLDLYFFYEPSLGFFRTDRGPQLRSHYRFKRYD